MRILDRVTQAGKYTFGQAGEIWYPELEVVHLLQSAGRARYDNLNNPRLRRHLLLYARHGLLKSTVADYFLHEFCDAISVTETRFSVPPERPVIYHVSGDQSWARGRGTVEEGEIITPYLAQSDYVFASELLTAITFGASTSYKGSVSDWNRALEEGRLEPSLVKMSNVAPEELEEKREAWEEAGLDIEFNSDHGALTFEVNASMVACSHILEEGVLKKLEQTGFLDRFHTAKWDPTTKVVEHMEKVGIGRPHRHDDKIREFNRKAWKTSWGEVPWPPQEYVSDAISVLTKGYNKIVEHFGTDPWDLISMRDAVDCAQYLTAAAIARSVDESDRYFIDELEYIDSDRDWVCEYLNRRLGDLHEQYMARARDADRIQRNHDLLVGFLRDRDSFYFRGPDFVDYIEDKRGCSSRTAYKYLREMREVGWVKTIKQGEYEASSTIKKTVDPEKALMEETAPTEEMFELMED